MFSSLCFSVLFLFHWDELLSPFPFGYGFSLFCSSPHLSLSSCALLHPPKPVCSFAIPSTPLQLFAVFPGLCYGSRCLSFGRSRSLACSWDASSFAAPPLPPAPSLVSPHPHQLLPSLLYEFGCRPSPHPGQPLLGPHPRSQTPAAFPASFQQLFPGTCPVPL